MAGENLNSARTLRHVDPGMVIFPRGETQFDIGGSMVRVRVTTPQSQTSAPFGRIVATDSVGIKKRDVVDFWRTSNNYSRI